MSLSREATIYFLKGDPCSNPQNNLGPPQNDDIWIEQLDMVTLNHIIWLHENSQWKPLFCGDSKYPTWLIKGVEIW